MKCQDLENYSLKIENYLSALSWIVPSSMAILIEDNIVLHIQYVLAGNCGIEKRVCYSDVTTGKFLVLSLRCWAESAPPG